MMKKGFVLIVDDNEDAADMLAVMLELAGWTTKAVYGGLNRTGNLGGSNI